MKISFIGFGNMAQAIAKHLMHIPNYEIFAASPSLSKGKSIDGIQTSNDNLAIIANSSIIILAAKPQNVENIIKQIGLKLPEGSLLISIVAGTELSYLLANCRANQAIVRCMPNLPIIISKGATALVANLWASSTQKELAERLFKCAGITAWLENEDDLDIITAISGSGPAYLFYFIEAIINAGKALGLSEKIIKPFILQTITGAMELTNNSILELSDLRKKVTSSGGTTAAAIDVLQKEDFNQVIAKAIKAAYTRAKFLGMLNNI